MPQRKITFPAAVQLVDPERGQPIEGPEGTLTFENFIAKLFANPLWNESWKHGMAQQSIARALKEGVGSIVIAEEDWDYLSAAAKNPRTVLFVAGAGMQIQPGLGYHPSIAGQVVPMQLAIINAEMV